MRVARESHVERFEALRGTEQEYSSVGATTLVKGDSSSQLFRQRAAKLRWRFGLHGGKQSKRWLEGAGITLCLGRGQSPVRPTRAVGREERGPFEKCCRGQETPPRLRSTRRSLEFESDAFVVSDG
jgi:hypothetical protein